ncbi:MAG TPA: ABC transporter substrate-binding protein [Polyangiaceae bacterium]|nr:ABC transporter substrate-binding protein [Polyangiaceae bacterium]
MRRRHFNLLLTSLLTLAVPLRAQNDDAVELIRTSVDAALTVLRDATLKKPEKRQERLARLRSIADGVFDWQEMAQSSLGVAYRKLTDAERQEFLGIFKDVIAMDYRDDLDRFIGDEKVEIKGAEARDELRLVKTILVTHSRDRVPLDYLMRHEVVGWRAIDFSIEGVSLVNHYRKSFARYLANHTFQELLARLRASAAGR